MINQRNQRNQWSQRIFFSGDRWAKGVCFVNLNGINHSFIYEKALLSAWFYNSCILKYC